MTERNQDQLSKDERKRLDKVLLELVHSEFDKKKVEQDNIELRRLVIKAFDAYELKSYIVSEADESGHVPKKSKNQQTDVIKPNSSVKVTVVKRSTVFYDLSRIKEKLSKKLVKMFVKTKREITDYATFKKLMKEYDVPYSRVKKCFSEVETVDQAKLENLYTIGEINIKDLKGCYTISEGEAFLKLTVINNKAE